MKFHVCLQFWEGDKANAMRLARFIADLEPEFRKDTEFVFIARFDCEHDHPTCKYVGLKFKTTWITSHTKWTGWPGGPNGMAKDTLEWLAANRRESGGALLIEPDCVPVCRGWLDRIMAEWDMARFAERILMGAWRNSGGEHGHINGNCVVRPDFAKAISLDCVGPDLAWDCAIVPYVRNRWFVTSIIKNCFESRNATNQDLFWAPIGDQLPALVHGFKDDSAYNIASRNLLEPDASELSL
jgi:hypothetical protein